MDSTKSILKSASHFFGGTILSRISGAVRDIAMAFAFGTKETVAAFFIAFRLAHLLRRLFGEGALQTAFVPRFEKIRQQSSARAGHFFTSLYLVLLLFLIGLVTISMAGLSRLSSEVASLTLTMMPSLIFICLWGLNCSLLQCEKKFFLPGASPVLFNAVWICGALSIRSFKPQEPMQALAIAIVAASAVQWAITVPQTLSILKKWGFSAPSLRNPELRTIAKPLFLGMLGVAAVQINSALDPLFAQLADAEGPAFLWYAIRIQQVPLALFGIALSSALLPPLSRALELGERAQYQKFLNYCLSRTLILMIPCTFILIFLGEWGISLVYGHGNFARSSIDGTALCLSGYAAGLIPMALVLVYAPAFYARGDYLTPSLASSLSVAANIALNALFVIYLGYGAASVAYATSFSAWVNFAILGYAEKTNRPLLSSFLHKRTFSPPKATN